MEGPDYLVCLDCESPCYDFVIKSEEVVEALCAVCGNEQPDQFLTESQYEELVG